MGFGSTSKKAIEMENKKPRKQRKVTVKHAEKVAETSDWYWLMMPPLEEEVETLPNGALHIPIERLRPLLFDRLQASVTNYKFQTYKDTYSNFGACGSLELTVTIDGKQRTVTGAYNMMITDAPNGFWNGTLKSECVKNAASELGKRLGRGLNTAQPKVETVAPKTEKPKPDADSKIMKQFNTAKEKGDKATMVLLSNIYTIKQS